VQADNVIKIKRRGSPRRYKETKQERRKPTIGVMDERKEKEQLDSGPPDMVKAHHR